MTVFDCNIAYGRGALALPRELETVEAVLDEMDHSGIDEALVWHRDAFERDFAVGNRRLVELDGHPRLHPAWTFVPTCCEEMPGAEAFLDAMRGAGVRAVRGFAATHRFCLEPESCGDLFDAFAERAVPVFLPLSEIPGQWYGVYPLLQKFPRLRVVVTQTGCWGQDRFFRPLMKSYPGFFITMDRFETAGQLKSLIDAAGFEHLLFGSGLPRNYPGAYLMALARAPIPDDAREAILHGNIERLLEEAAP